MATLYQDRIMNFDTTLLWLGRHTNANIVARLTRGPLRFNDLLAALDGTTESALSASLRELDASSIVARRVDPGPPLRVLYELTPQGLVVAPALATLAAWAARPRERLGFGSSTHA